MFFGGGLLTISLLGKGGIHLYRAVKAGNAFARPSVVGRYY